MNFPSLISLIILTLSSSWAQFSWQTTREGRTSGICKVNSSRLEIELGTHSMTVAEEAEFLTLGEVFSGDANTLEITGSFYLPEGSTLRSMLLWWKDDILKAKLRNKRQADSLYEDVVDRNLPQIIRRDPALIEYMGNNRYEFKIYPVAIEESRKIRILYTVPISYEEESFVFKLKPAFLPNGYYNPEYNPGKISVVFHSKSLVPQTYYLQYGTSIKTIQFNSNYIFDPSVLTGYDPGQRSYQLPLQIVPKHFKTGGYGYRESNSDISGYYYSIWAALPKPVKQHIEVKQLSHYSLEASMEFENQTLLADVTNSQMVHFISKFKSRWSPKIIWNIYEKTGELSFSHNQKIEVDYGEPSLSALPMMWASHYTLVERNQSLGDIFGFVDPKMSLLALEEDALPEEEAELWREGGVPLLDKGEIIGGDSHYSDIPENSILVDEFTDGLIGLLNENGGSLLKFSFREFSEGWIKFSLNTGETILKELKLYSLQGKLIRSWNNIDIRQNEGKVYLGETLKGSYVLIAHSGKRILRLRLKI